MLAEDYETDYGFTIPKGFLINGASIPRLVWSAIGGPYSPDILRASVIHDYMYIHKLGRDKADNAFYRVLQEDDTHGLKAYLMYVAVKSFGWLYY